MATRRKRKRPGQDVTGFTVVEDPFLDAPELDEADRELLRSGRQARLLGLNPVELVRVDIRAERKMRARDELDTTVPPPILRTEDIEPGRLDPTSRRVVVSKASWVSQFLDHIRRDRRVFDSHRFRVAFFLLLGDLDDRQARRLLNGVREAWRPQPELWDREANLSKAINGCSAPSLAAKKAIVAKRLGWRLPEVEALWKRARDQRSPYRTRARHKRPARQLAKKPGVSG